MKTIAPLFALLLLLFAPVPGFAANQAATWDHHSKLVELSRYVDYWREPEVPADISDILELPGDAWASNGSDSVNLGYGSDVYWFRVVLENVTSVEEPVFLEIGYPVLDRIEIYTDPAGASSEPLVLGDKQPFYDRPIHHRNFIVPVTMPAGAQTTLYLRVETTSSMQLPLTLWNKGAFYANEQSQSMVDGLYYGSVLVLVIYNVFIFMAVGERSILHYLGYITAMPIFLASLKGVTFQYLWPSATWWNDQSILIFLNMLVLFGGTFTLRFINITRENHPLLERVTVALVFGACVLAMLGFLVPYKYMILPTIFWAFVGCVNMTMLSVVRWIHGDPAARYYAFAWIFMLIGGVVLGLSKFTILPRNFLTENATQIGSALGVILLSIALADQRLRREKRLVYDAQQSLLREERSARLAQEKSLQAHREANALLERRVQKRTEDLEKLNNQLRQLSTTDSLTGLKNRGFFDDKFRSAVVHAYRYEEELALLVLDIDHFKRFNDKYGHLVGDDCLKMVASCIENQVTRSQDFAARYGGEEFVVLLPETPEGGAVNVAEKIRRDIENTAFRVSGETLTLTVSVGVCSLAPTKPDATNEIFGWADAALYLAKEGGRNQVMVWKPQGEYASEAFSPA